MLKQNVFKKLGISLITLLCLTALLVFIFRDNLEDISAALTNLSASELLCLFTIGCTYQILDGLACWLLVKPAVPQFTYRQALGFVYLGVFGRTSTFGAGTVPMRAYYLHRCGIDVGQGVGIMSFSYVLHKLTVMIVVSVLLLPERQWLGMTHPDLHLYLIAGYLICLISVGLLLLLCTWNRAREFALWLTEKLFESEKWSGLKSRIQLQLDYLYDSTTVFLKNKKVVLSVILIHGIKLGIFCAVPYLCMKILGTDVISFAHTELLTSLVLLLSGALPNVAGIGPTEAAYYLLYRPMLGNALTTSSLLLFRISTYYFPFFASVAVFLIIQAKLMGKTGFEEGQRNENWCH